MARPWLAAAPGDSPLQSAPTPHTSRPMPNSHLPPRLLTEPRVCLSNRLHPSYLLRETRGSLVDAFWGSSDLGASPPSSSAPPTPQHHASHLRLCTPSPHPRTAFPWLLTTLSGIMNHEHPPHQASPTSTSSPGSPTRTTPRPASRSTRTCTSGTPGTRARPLRRERGAGACRSGGGTRATTRRCGQS